MAKSQRRRDNQSHHEPPQPQVAEMNQLFGCQHGFAYLACTGDERARFHGHRRVEAMAEFAASDDQDATDPPVWMMPPGAFEPMMDHFSPRNFSACFEAR